MKSNSKPFKIFEFSKFFKPFLIVLFSIVLVGVGVFAFFGFNLGFDFVGGTQLVVQFADNDLIQTQQGLNDVADKTKQILSENGANLNSFQVQGEYYEKCFVITFKKVSDDRLYNIRLELNKNFNTSDTYANLKILNQQSNILDDSADVTKLTTQIESLVLPTALISTLATLIFALVVAMIYAGFRFKLASALSMVFKAFFDVLLTLSIIAIARVELNNYVFAVLGLILVVSVFGSVNLFNNIKQKLKDPMFADKSNKEIANIVTNENLSVLIISSLFALVTFDIVGTVGVFNIFNLSIFAFVGLAVCFVSTLFIAPSFWAKINIKRVSKPSVLISNGTNDLDKDAEIVEVK